jgi:hypothetical protein
MRFATAFVATVTGLLLAGAARADVCSGQSSFQDVQQNDTFCSSVEFLRNRNITNGCQPNLFCPNDTVTRAQMAVFFERAGTLAPRTSQSFDDPAPWDGSTIHCRNPALPAEQYGRMVRADLRVYGEATGPVDLTIEAKRSVDGIVWPTGNITVVEVTIPAGKFNVPVSTYAGFNAGLVPHVGFRITSTNPGLIAGGGCEVIWLVTERIPF